MSAVVTQPDKPCGRGKKLTPPPVKTFALEKGIKVLQHKSVRTQEFEDQLKELSPDLAVVVAYGKILPLNILNLPKFGCINIHASLLPYYRGAAPINWAIIKGEKVTGVTSMFMDEGMDAGDILLQKKAKITESMDACDLHDTLAELGAQVLLETLESLENNRLVRIPQKHESATYAPMMSKELGLIEWNTDCRDIHNLVRGVTPWPGAYTFYMGNRMKVWGTEICNADECAFSDRCESLKPGQILDTNRSGITVKCGNGAIKLKAIQMDNCRKMGSEECWHNIYKGEKLGDYCT
ncbi:MAG: methionyl-tRNA formyltransferase [Eubacteriales bacterium]|nr:methionyl-tRNA formyltransferase [Eubacteriales bacterium]